jgi:hypothetical protein
MYSHYICGVHVYIYYRTKLDIPYSWTFPIRHKTLTGKNEQDDRYTSTLFLNHLCNFPKLDRINISIFVFCTIIMASKVLDLRWKLSKTRSHLQAGLCPWICLHEGSLSLHLMCCLLLWLPSPMGSQQLDLQGARFHG